MCVGFVVKVKERRCDPNISQSWNLTLTQELKEKVKLSWGISISEDDVKSKVLCRPSVSFVNKMCDFIRTVTTTHPMKPFL